MMLLPATKSSLRIVAAASAAVLVLGLPGTASADHVSATYSATAKLGERVGNAWTVEVEWSIVCNGASRALYSGDLSLVDQGSEERIFLGGTAGPSGTSTASVSMTTTPRTLKPRLNSACADSGDLHGSDTQEFFGNEVVVPALSCDPELMARALREYDTAEAFYNAAIQDLQQAHDEYVDARNKWVAQTALITGAGAAAKQALSEKLLKLATKANIVAKIFKAIESVSLKLIPTLRETRRVFKAAREDMQRAEAWRMRAEASLDAALAQGPCLGSLQAQLDQALDEQRRQGEANALIESWENNGYLYLNPATGELLDERAALREALRVLGGTQRTAQSRAAHFIVTDGVSDVRRLRAAIAKLSRARTLNERVRVRVKRADEAAQQLRTRLRALFADAGTSLIR